MLNNGKCISAARAIEIDRKAFGRKVKQYNLTCSTTAEKRSWRKKSESQLESKKSSNVQVKDEPLLENEFNVETDSETEHDDIEVDKLQPLNPKFATLTKFPIRCKVLYDFLCRSTKPTKCLQAKRAYVEEAYIHDENHNI